MSTITALGRRRRNHELGLGIHAIAIVIGAYILLALASGPSLPPETPYLLAGIGGLYLVAHLALRRFAPNADGTIIPIVATLNGIGFVAISRLVRDNPKIHHLPSVQSTWTALGVAIFVATLFIVRDLRMLIRYRYTSAFAGTVLLLLPLVPHPIGETINGARIWARLGPISFQPGELAKVLLVVFFAGYLVDNRDLLAQGTRRVGPFRVPDPKHLGPLLAVWAMSIIVLVAEKDLGSSLLLFSVFVSMLYVATNRGAYLGGSFVLFAVGATFAYKYAEHVRVRVDTWLNPWPQAQTGGYQIIQSWYAFGAGGISGRGLGLGAPDKVPVAVSDFILAAIGEELGLFGTVAVVILFLLLIGAGLRAAIDHPDPFAQLLATGLTVILGVQTFVIVGGVTRLIPLTGVTLPFVSYGGSSLIGNFIVIALLARVSDGASTARMARS